MNHNLICRGQAFLLAVVLLLSLAMPAEAAGETTVTLDQTALTLAPGGTGTLTATVASPPENTVLTWESSDGKIATVTQDNTTPANCIVTAVAAGTAIIKVTATPPTNGGAPVSATCTVTVSEPTVKVERVEITTPDNMNTVETGTPLTLAAVVYPTDATNQAVKWSSSDTSVATVDADGRVSGVAPGKATITVTTVDGGKTDTHSIECSGIALSESSLRLIVNQSQSLSFPLYGAAASKNVEWYSSNSSVAEVVGGRITAHSPGTATITASVYGMGYSADCSVVVEEDLAGAIEMDVDAGQPCSFSDADFQSDLNYWCWEKTGGSLQYLTGLSVPTSQGVLYYGYISPDAHGHGVGGSERYYRRASGGQNALSDLSFVPRSDFGGTAVISYTGYADNGRSFNGTIRIAVEENQDVAYSTAENRPLEFSAAEFTAVCQARTGRTVRYITFEQPSSGRGTLYYNYSAAAEFSQRVDSGTKYYATSTPSLDLITFVPEEDYTGTVSVYYNCVDSAGGSYRGRVTVTVYAASGGAGRGDVEYTTGVDEDVELDASDFNDACRDANDKNLNYIYFELPRAREGVLYYNYTNQNNYGSRVSESTRYYRNSSPRISSVTFVPADDFEGTVTIPFTGYDSSGDKFSGELVIRVTDDDSEGVVRYSTTAGNPVEFDAADFNEACRRSNKTSLDRISFELPSSSRGTLYYNYTNSNNVGSRVSASTSYYRSGSPSLSRITFVPKRGYTGTVTIPFKGYDADGYRFNGTVRIEVGGADDETVTYRAVSGELVEFDAADFNSVCRDITGENLNYVRFALPASRYGTLYYQYNKSKESGTKLNASTNYYRTGSNRQLNDVSFLVADGYTGTISIDYDGRSSGGEDFFGTVEIVVGPEAGSIPDIDIYFRDIYSSAYYFDAVRWAVGNGITSGTTPTTFSPDIVCTRAQTVTFLWRAAGSPAPKSGVNPFKDVSASAYYYNAVLWAVEQGITSGSGTGTFSPDAVVNRAQAVTFLYRRAGAPASGTGEPFSDVKNTEYFASAVRWAVVNGITSGTSANTFSPDTACTRAQIVTFLYRYSMLQ